jgi:hypothetical protein
MANRANKEPRKYRNGHFEIRLHHPELRITFRLTVSQSKQTLAHRMVIIGTVFVICAIPFGYSFACAFESSPYLAVTVMIATPVVGGTLHCVGSYLILKNHIQLPQQKPLPSKFVIWLLFAQLSFVGMLCLTSVVANLTHSGIGMCGFYGSDWFMLPLLGSIPVSILVGILAGRWLRWRFQRITN